MKKIVFLTILLSLSTFLFAQPAKIESIKEYMKINGEKENLKLMMYQTLNNALPTFKQIAPNAPESFWDKVIKEAPTNKLYEAIVPIYQKHLSEKEIQVLIKFFKTPVGKKIIEIQPNLYNDSVLIGQKIGRQYANEFMQEYKSKYGNSKL